MQCKQQSLVLAGASYKKILCGTDKLKCGIRKKCVLQNKIVFGKSQLCVLYTKNTTKK
jgi:hypothetical protein